jgi:hypothetical protein
MKTQAFLRRNFELLQKLELQHPVLISDLITVAAKVVSLGVKKNHQTSLQMAMVRNHYRHRPATGVT